MSCTNTDKIIQGDTGPIWHITVPQIDADGNATGSDTVLTNYTCSLTVDTQTAAITGKNTAGDAFLVQLSSTVTGLLDLGAYAVGIEVRNDVLDPPYVSEVHKRVKITTPLVP